MLLPNGTILSETANQVTRRTSISVKRQILKLQTRYETHKPFSRQLNSNFKPQEPNDQVLWSYDRMVYQYRTALVVLWSIFYWHSTTETVRYGDCRIHDWQKHNQRLDLNLWFTLLEFCWFFIRYEWAKSAKLMILSLDTWACVAFICDCGCGTNSSLW